jgi:exodeoxyribonuclease V gamma subunit
VRHEPPPLLDGPLPARPPEDVSLADLKDFLVRPARTFLRGRLDVSAPFEPDELADAIPVDLSSLELWKVGDRLLRELLAGQDPVKVMTAEQLADRLPPGLLGHRSLQAVAQECQQLWTRTEQIREGAARSVDVDVDLGEGRRLTGTVTGVYGTRVVSLGYSRLKPRQRLQTWVDLLALTATYDDHNWTGHAVGRERAGPKRALSGPVDDRAAGWLRDLVDLRDVGLTRPLPIPVATAAAWAEAHVRSLAGQDVDPADAARRAWETDPHNRYGIEGEDADPFHRRVFGDDAPLEKLLANGLPGLAWQVWEPLLTGAERLGPL